MTVKWDHKYSKRAWMASRGALMEEAGIMVARTPRLFVQQYSYFLCTTNLSVKELAKQAGVKIGTMKREVYVYGSSGDFKKKKEKKMYIQTYKIEPFRSDLHQPLKSRHREKYCFQRGKVCVSYEKCLDHHVFVEQLDDKPFKRYRESRGKCYEV